MSKINYHLRNAYHETVNGKCQIRLTTAIYSVHKTSLLFKRFPICTYKPTLLTIKNTPGYGTVAGV